MAEEERQTGEGPLSPRKQRDGLEPLAARLRHELDPGVERVSARLGLDQLQLGTAPSKSRSKSRPKWPLISSNAWTKRSCARARHAAKRLVEVLDRRREIVVLSSKKRQPLVELAILVVGPPG